MKEHNIPNIMHRKYPAMTSGDLQTAAIASLMMKDALIDELKPIFKTLCELDIQLDVDAEVLMQLWNSIDLEQYDEAVKQARELLNYEPASSWPRSPSARQRNPSQPWEYLKDETEVIARTVICSELDLTTVLGVLDVQERVQELRVLDGAAYKVTFLLEHSFNTSNMGGDVFSRLQFPKMKAC